MYGVQYQTGAVGGGMVKLPNGAMMATGAGYGGAGAAVGGGVGGGGIIGGGPGVMPAPAGGIVGGGVIGGDPKTWGPVVQPAPPACGVSCGEGCKISCGDACGCGPGGGAGCGVGCAEMGCGGGYDEAGVLSFVGPGQGDYRASTTYTYVGRGAGDMEMVMVPTKIRGNLCYCLVMIPLTLMLLWLLMPVISSDTTTTTTPAPDTTSLIPPITTFPPTTPPPPPPPNKDCSVYGDPHAMTFDGYHADYYTSGEFWIVKSSVVEIQGKYSPTHATNGLAVTKQIAIGGTLIGGKVLIIGEEHATYDGAAILTSFPSHFSSPDSKVDIVYNGEGQLLQPGREGKTMHVLHVSLPNNVKVQVNRWDEAGEGKYINVKISMAPVPGQDGQCGNYNGNVADDSRLAVQARLGKEGVPESELLFPGPKTEVNHGIVNCPDSTLIKAHAECKAVTSSFWPKMECLETVCAGGTAE